MCDTKVHEVHDGIGKNGPSCTIVNKVEKQEGKENYKKRKCFRIR